MSEIKCKLCGSGVRESTGRDVCGLCYQSLEYVRRPIKTTPCKCGKRNAGVGRAMCGQCAREVRRREAGSRPRGSWREQWGARDDALLKDYLKNISLKSILYKYNLKSNASITKILKRNNIKPRERIRPIKQKKGCITKTGYRVYSVGRNNRILEHRAVMQEHLGRKLDSREVVHHIDENRLNNAIDNLMVMSLTEHINLHRHSKIK